MQVNMPNFFKFKVVTGTPLGRACVATKKIKKGEIICKFIGPIINTKQAIDKHGFDNCIPLQIGADEFIDLIEPYVCFNHSCKPNAGIRNNGILFALETIQPGQKIEYDYSTTVDDVLWSMDCRCLNKGCRKKIADFQSISHEQKQRYLALNALTAYIKQTFY